MENTIRFSPRHLKLVCVDSDGCVINGMTAKHVKCFGPGIVEVFSLEEHKEDILSYWNKVNLYSNTRGVNRFLGLVMALEYAVEKGYLKLDISDLVQWTADTKELSNASLEAWIEKKREEKWEVPLCLTLAREWSLWVNRHVAKLSLADKQAFAGAKEGIRCAKQKANVVVVSSANRGAVEEEWKENRLLKDVDLLMTQEYGSKASCLQQLKGMGYGEDCILMVGDGLGDMQAAKDTGVLFYPILPGQEEESWRSFIEEVLPDFLAGRYRKKGMEDWQRKMLELLQ